MSEWQSIETAPKDGRKILVYGPCGEDERKDDYYVSYWEGRFWYIEDEFAYYNAKPTHWMPLPEPPK